MSGSLFGFVLGERVWWDDKLRGDFRRFKRKFIIFIYY